MTKAKAVIYLYKDGFDYFGTDKPQLLKQAFAPSVVQDLEVVSKEEYAKVIEEFISTQKLAPARVLIVLSETIFFSKEFPLAGNPPTVPDTDIAEYLENVPFEKVASKKYPRPKDVLVAAANREFFTRLQQEFEKHGWSVSGAVSSFVFEKEVKLSGQLTPDAAKFFLSKIDAVRQTDNFLDQQQASMAAHKSAPAAFSSHSKSKLPLLVGVFGLLLAVLGGLYYWQNRPLPPSSASPVVTAPSEAPPEILPSPEESTAEADISPDQIRIQILNASAIAGQADRMRQDLEGAGFSNIQVGTSSTIVPRTLVVFVSSVPSSIREAVVTEVQGTYPDVSVQQTDNAQYDVVITLGRASAAGTTVTP